MEIIGRGFVAQNLEPIAGRHNDVVVFAAGVSSGTSAAHEEFAREADLLYRTIDDCTARGKRLVYFSTASPTLYGGSLVYGREDGPVYPSSPYARHKLAMEAVLASSTVDYLTLRATHLIGPRQRPHQLPPVMVAQVRAKSVRVFRGVYRDFLAITDLVTILDALLKTDVGRQVINVASGFPVPIEDIVEHLERRMGVTAVREYVDRPEPAVTISTERLRRLAPIVDTLLFDEYYYQRALDEFLALSLKLEPASS